MRGRPVELVDGVSAVPCECTYRTPTKRRGRQQVILDRLRSEQSDSGLSSMVSTSTALRSSPRPSSHANPVHGVGDDAGRQLELEEHAVHNLGDGAFPEHHLPVPDGPQHSQEPHLIDCEGYDTHVGLLPQHSSNPPEPLVPITYIAQRPSPSVSLQSPSAFLADAAPLQSTRIADILPRNTALSILKLFFDHVYCIIPVVHYPTFMDAVDAREDERNPMFFVLTLQKNGDGVLTGAAMGTALQLAIDMRLFDEETYAGLSPIDAERGRRVWFLIHNADKVEAISNNRPILLRSDEFRGPGSAELPRELHDSSITADGYLPRGTSTPLIAGFNVLTRIVTVLGDILVKERDVIRRPPADSETLFRELRNVRDLRQCLVAVVTATPAPFALELSASSPAFPVPGWETALLAQVDEFFDNPGDSPQDGYLVLKANVQVTLAMTRLRLILLRERLLQSAGAPGTPPRNAAELVAVDLGENNDWRQMVYQTLLQTVHGLPIQALAANGPSLVAKIRVVAVTLLEGLPGDTEGNSEIAQYLIAFLSIMSSIEEQFAE
ncbi:uncharacterized protein EHS24_005548 [Apiotrichum porosum]|uniref:Transcription factor domain-containing protein n=1 Tax=Apiotrichum porosum TaxID=105984 RepID=A0A427XCH4_9TREE|nr:uncharacterized protein EHS24_005548 [Apiotrichum porosum]RSH76559.1 hypothetical protein EHS24_005548 [Apiotrichum porosum]